MRDARRNPLISVPSHRPQRGRPEGTRLVLVNDGSFNPVHRGHINVTLAAAQFARDMGYTVAAVYMVPNHPSWLMRKFASRTEIMPGDDRLQMMRAATAGTEIRVSDWELRKPVYQNSDEYKRYFETLHPGATFVRLTGEDYGSCAPMPCFEFRDSVWYMRLPRTEGLSSTKIRRAVQSGESTQHFAYPHVRDYMGYKVPLRPQARRQARANPQPVVRKASTRNMRMHKVLRDFFATHAKLFEAHPNLWVKGGGARDVFLTFYADKSGKGQDREPTKPRDIDLLLVGGTYSEKLDLERRFADGASEVDVDIGSSTLSAYFQSRDVGVNEVALRPDQLLYTQKALNDVHRGTVFPTHYEYRGDAPVRSRLALRSALLAHREGLQPPPSHMVEPSLREAGSFNLLVHLHKAYETGIEDAFFETIRGNKLLAGTADADEALVALTEATPQLIMTPVQLQRFNQAKHRIQTRDIDDDEAWVTRKRSRLRANPQSIVYVGAMLDDPTALLRWWSTHVGKVLPVPYAHHMTIKFRPADSDLDALRVGAPVGLHIVGFADDGQVQAVAVEPIGVHSTSPVPHVTVATNGTPPVKSNELLARGYVPVNGPVISARVGLFTGKDDVFTRSNPRFYRR